MKMKQTRKAITGTLGWESEKKPRTLRKDADKLDLYVHNIVLPADRARRAQGLPERGYAGAQIAETLAYRPEPRPEKSEPEKKEKSPAKGPKPVFELPETSDASQARAKLMLRSNKATAIYTVFDAKTKAFLYSGTGQEVGKAMHYRRDDDAGKRYVAFMRSQKKGGALLWHRAVYALSPEGRRRRGKSALTSEWVEANCKLIASDPDPRSRNKKPEKESNSSH